MKNTFASRCGRGSNSRPQPWQGCALPTELFPHFRGQGQIRTAEAVRQQIYSLPVLTTYLPTQSTDFRQNLVTPAGFKPTTF